MQKNFEEDKLHREKQNNFKEEIEIENEKRHKKLLAALEDLKKNLGVSETVTAEPAAEQEGSFIDKIFDGIGGISGIMKAVRFLSPLLTSPVGIAIIAALAAGSFAKFLVALRERDKELNPQDYENVPSEIAEREGITKGAAGARNQRKALKQIRASEIKDALETNPKFTDAELVDMYGRTRPELEEWLKANPKGVLKVEPTATKVPPSPTPAGVETPTTPSNPSPASPVSSTPAKGSTSSAMPAETTPATAKLNTVTSENNTAKINAMVEPSVSTINNTVSSSTGVSSVPEERVKIPPVRNLEESFQKMILYSTRVV
jgi:hypothetical protein